MLRPSNLIRLALVGGVVFLLRAIAREAADARQAPPRLPPPASGRRKARAAREPRSGRARRSRLG